MAARAIPISDPIGDLATGYLAAHSGVGSNALDVVSAEVTLVGGANFVFTATMADDIATAPANAAYVFGLDRGNGLPLE